MSWLKISVEADGASAEALSERMLACGALSVSFGASEVADGEVLEPPPDAAPLWNQVTVTGLFPPAVDAQALSLALGPVAAKRIDWLEDQDWAAADSSEVPELRFGDRLAVVSRDAPSHLSYGKNSRSPSPKRVWVATSRAGRPRSDLRSKRFPRSEGVPPSDRARSFPSAVLRLDLGLAFGTGQHPTTRSCLAWLADARLEGRSVLDYGCGSGILGIAAALLGAARVVAVDVEPQALWATQANARFNGVALDAVITPEEFPTQLEFDLVLANILANTLVELGPALSGCLNSGGQLVLAGVLESQVGAVQAAYPGLAFDPPFVDGEWARLTGRRRD